MFYEYFLIIEYNFYYGIIKMKKITFFILLVILLLIGIGIFYFSTNNREQYIRNDVSKIDIVYTWVDNSPEFIKEKNEWFNKEKNIKYDQPSDIRYTDHKELLYSLRSLQKNFPHYNKIYLVVKDGQFPKYLKRNNQRLVIVNHSEIIPKEYLPTFNSRAIEAYLHHIPNLSTHYLYLNDDCMFLKPTDLSYFIDKNNKPYTIHTNTYIQKTLNNNLNLDSNSFRCGLSFNSNILDSIYKNEDRTEVSHSPMMYNKIYDNHIEQFFKNYYNKDEDINAFDKTGMSKFRRCDDLHLVSILKPYLYRYWFNSSQKPSESEFIIDFNKKVNHNSRFLNIEPVNDLKIYLNFMNKLFPVKSEFEL